MSLQSFLDSLGNFQSALDLAKLAAENNNASAQTQAINELALACTTAVGEAASAGAAAAGANPFIAFANGLIAAQAEENACKEVASNDAAALSTAIQAGQSAVDNALAPQVTTPGEISDFGDLNTAIGQGNTLAGNIADAGLALQLAGFTGSATISPTSIATKENRGQS